MEKKNTPVAANLTFVRPERREMIETRIRAIEKFLALDRSTSRDAEELSKEAGVSTPTFYVLVRAWKKSRNPLDLQGGRIRKQYKSRKLGDEEFLASILPNLSHEASTEQAVAEIERIAIDQGTKVRSRVSLRTAVEAFRRENRLLGRPNSADLSIDYAALEMAVADGNDAFLPVAGVLFDTRSLKPICALLTLDPPTPAFVAKLLAKSIHDGSLVDGGAIYPTFSSIYMAIGQRDEWGKLTDALTDNGINRIGEDDRTRLSIGIINRHLAKSLLGFKAFDRSAFFKRTQRAILIERKKRSQMTLATAQGILDARIPAASNPKVSLPSSTNTKDLLAALMQA